jgi:hypothetical protein
MDREMAENADLSERHGTDHTCQVAARRLGHRPAGVAHAAQEVESPGVGRPAYDAPELQDALQVSVVHLPDADTRVSLCHGP